MKGLRKLGYWLSVLCLLTACNTLEIRSEQGAKSTSASPEPVAPLDGTSWRLVSFDGHDLIEGTDITLRFADGFVQGFAGCNAYRPLIIGSDDETHQYRATRDDSPTADAAQSGCLTIPNFIITDRDCPSLEGVMQQERAYVETLRNAAAYRIIEDHLEIKNAAGETILVFDRGTSTMASPTPVPTSEAVIPPTSWMTYTNSAHRFSLRHPPEWEAPPRDFSESRGTIGDQVVFSVSAESPYWIGCLFEGLGDCPVMEQVEITPTGDPSRNAIQIRGYIGSIGGRIPQQYITYALRERGNYYTFTLYAVGLDAATGDVASIVPLDEGDVAAFERMMATLTFRAGSGG